MIVFIWEGMSAIHYSSRENEERESRSNVIKGGGAIIFGLSKGICVIGVLDRLVCYENPFLENLIDGTSGV